MLFRSILPAPPRTCAPNPLGTTQKGRRFAGWPWNAGSQPGQPRPTCAPNPLGTTQKGRRFAGLGGWGGGRGVLRLWLRRWAGHDPTVDFATMMQLEPHGPDVFVAPGPQIGRAAGGERGCPYG